MNAAIKAARIAAGYETQAALAREVNCTRSHIYAIESGLRVPSRKLLLGLVGAGLQLGTAWCEWWLEGATAGSILTSARQLFAGPLRTLAERAGVGITSVSAWERGAVGAVTEDIDRALIELAPEEQRGEVMMALTQVRAGDLERASATIARTYREILGE